MPLVMLALLMVSWVGGRAAVWENPFQLPPLDVSIDELFAHSDSRHEHSEDQSMAGELAMLQPTSTVLVPQKALSFGTGFAPYPASAYSSGGLAPEIAIGHERLLSAALAVDWHSSGLDRIFGGPYSGRAGLIDKVGEVPPPFAAQPAGTLAGGVDRWSLDLFAFYRQRSGSLSPSQGRTPVYGASQLAANLQYRVAPQSEHDPRAFLRAYHALVSDGETELAAGVSARPIGQLPLRLAAEIRATRNSFGTELRPAAYAISEVGAQRLPLGAVLESYVGAGYVGGESSTFFIDGQAAITREVIGTLGSSERPIRISVGAAGWGGAQEDASRFDVGPTMRLDLSVGEVPARISVDWRERVAGDAEPTSGVAATVSTRF